jgi:UDP-N-acetylglucosamine--N-acetylmuramyl-(pentapeptide) pyrophosphoryl-undecaprenol N-acetylglucosamine transferase
MDRSLVESGAAASGVKVAFFGISAGRLRRYFSLKTIGDAFRIVAGFFEARKILRREKPAVLFSKGGFVSVPPCAAARSLKIPVFTHESDFSPGLATKINARMAQTIFTTYEATKSFFPASLQSKVQFVGQPVRREFFIQQSSTPHSSLVSLLSSLCADLPLILVLGGSQGAKQVNEIIWRLLPRLTEICTVVHQTGEGENAFTGDNKWPGRYFPLAYIKEGMPELLEKASLVVGRAGAGTVWESAARGKAMLLIPLAGSGTRGDQVENAEFFRKAGAAEVIDGAADDACEKIFNFVKNILNDGAKLKAMSDASFKTGRRDAAGAIAKVLLETT